jgi:hypothetical protein
MMEKNVLIKSLAEGVVTVTFTKKDGSDRVMKCTRNPGMIPAEYQPKNSEESVEINDNIRVFDVENLGWRSFNFSTLKG